MSTYEESDRLIGRINYGLPSLIFSKGLIDHTQRPHREKRGVRRSAEEPGAEKEMGAVNLAIPELAVNRARWCCRTA